MTFYRHSIGDRFTMPLINGNIMIIEIVGYVDKKIGVFYDYTMKIIWSSSRNCKIGTTFPFSYMDIKSAAKPLTDIEALTLLTSEPYQNER